MTKLILQKTLPNPPWLDPVRWRLPGVQPLAPEDWLIRDEAFAEQMALRDHLLTNEFNAVHALRSEAFEAAQECYDTVLAALHMDQGFHFKANACTRPDGVKVELDRNAPLATLGRLIQEDLCLMSPGPAEHILTGAILCFPAYWTLSEKLGRPLTTIHTPVAEYTSDVGRRVQRLFDAVRPDRPLCRMNANIHSSGELFTPKRESEPERRVGTEDGRYVRSERQVLRKLPTSGVTVFSIHTYIVRIEDLPRDAQDALPRLAAT